jgi:hypothetical protein
MSEYAVDTVHNGASILSPALAALGPNVIAATGGSGTRVVARIVRAGGMYTGLRLNRFEDALDFSAYNNRWIDRYLVQRRAGTHAALEAEMSTDLRSVLAGHCADLPAEAIRWGWKEPRSIYLLPFLRSQMPTLRFLHVVRDGRDMAFSDNQRQLMKHGDAALAQRVSRRQPVRSIALWSWVNESTADFGERELGADYLRLRFEDLCAEPRVTVERIYEFFGLEGDVDAAAAEVHPPDTVGRWRERPRRLVRRLEQEAGPALRRFGYLDA